MEWIRDGDSCDSFRRCRSLKYTHLGAMRPPFFWFEISDLGDNSEMKSFIYLSLLFSINSFAQTPEKGFVEISPEQEKRIREIELKKEIVLRKKAEAKFAAEKKTKADKERKEAEVKLAAHKKAEEEKRKADEDKKLEAERKKKAEVEAYTQWLISERDRKMKEEQEKKAGPENVQAPVGTPQTVKAFYEAGRAPEIPSHMRPENQHSGIGFSGQGKAKARTSLKCEKNKLTTAWEKEFRRLRGDIIREFPRKGFHAITEEKLQAFLCSCRFPENNNFPSSAKVIGISGYEGKYLGNEKKTIDMHPETDVTIKVNSREPVILVIDAYEPVRWFITGPVAGIFIVGYHNQKLNIAGNVPVLKSQMLAEKVHVMKKFELGSDLCMSTNAALILNPPMESMEAHGIVSSYSESSRKKILDDRSLLIFGRKLSSFSYNYTFPQIIEVND